LVSKLSLDFRFLLLGLKVEGWWLQKDQTEDKPWDLASLVYSLPGHGFSKHSFPLFYLLEIPLLEGRVHFPKGLFSRGALTFLCVGESRCSMERLGSSSGVPAVNLLSHLNFPPVWGTPPKPHFFLGGFESLPLCFFLFLFLFCSPFPPQRYL